MSDERTMSMAVFSSELEFPSSSVASTTIKAFFTGNKYNGCYCTTGGAAAEAAEAAGVADADLALPLPDFFAGALLVEGAAAAAAAAAPSSLLKRTRFRRGTSEDDGDEVEDEASPDAVPTSPLSAMPKSDSIVAAASPSSASIYLYNSSSSSIS